MVLSHSFSLYKSVQHFKCLSGAERSELACSSWLFCSAWDPFQALAVIMSSLMDVPVRISLLYQKVESQGIRWRHDTWWGKTTLEHLAKSPIWMRKEHHIFHPKLLQGNGLLNYPRSEGKPFPKSLSSVWWEEAESACSMTLGSAVRHMHADVRKASCTFAEVVNSNMYSCLGKLFTALGFFLGGG